MRTPPLTPSLVFFLTLPQLLWAGNAVVGRALVDSAPPVLLNALRWALALLLLLPLTRQIWRQPEALRTHWRWWLITGFLGMSSYNTLQYQALHTSSAMNVTLIAASLPLAMLLVGRLVFSQHPRPRQVAGALLSLVGVLVVVSHGSWAQLLQLRFVQGDLLMLLATLSWAGYSWMLTRRPAALADWPWADLLAVQMLFGLVVAAPLVAAEHAWTPLPLALNGTLAAALAYIAIGPSLVAYRCWSLGVSRGGPALAGFFVNLTPLFAALLSMAALGESAQGFHAVAFGLIAGGILVSARAR